MKTEFDKGFYAYENGFYFDPQESEEWQNGWKAAFKFWME